MARGALHPILRHLRRVAEGPAGGQTDRQLLERFATTRDETAFELLVWRHGPTVWGVCLRVLGHTQDAEDAFQAAFLVLARKAGSIARGEVVGSWLYRVAYRVAVRARAGRRAAAPLSVEMSAPIREEAVANDLKAVLDEVVSGLPEKYRAPVVLCYLEGRTHAEAARQLGCAPGTVAVRLLRARARLRGRLSCRGVSLGVGAVGGLFAGGARAAVPPTLAGACLRLVARPDAAAGATKAVVSLAEGVLRATAVSQLKALAAVLVLVVGVLGTGAGMLLTAAPPARPSSPPPTARAGQPAPRPPLRLEVPSETDGILLVVGTEVGKDDKVEADRLVVLPGAGQPRYFRELRVGDRVHKGQMVALVDDRLARTEVAVKTARLEEAQANYKTAVAVSAEAKKRWESMSRANKAVRGAVSEEDLRAARLSWERFQAEEKLRAAQVRLAEAEVAVARTRLACHEVRTGMSGVVRAILRRRGEAVRALDPVVLIEERTGAGRVVPLPGKERIRVPAARAGILQFLGTEVRPGEKVTGGQRFQATLSVPAVTVNPGEHLPPDEPVFRQDGRTYCLWKEGMELPPGEVVLLKQAREFRPLEVGDRVTRGQLIGLVNPAVAVDTVAIRLAKLDAAQAEWLATAKTREETERRYQSLLESRPAVPGATSDEDVRAAKLQWRRYTQEAIHRAALIRLAQRELAAALINLQLYEVRSPATGKVEAIHKRPGEAVRALETVVEVAADGRRE